MDYCNGLPMEAAQERKAIAVRGAFQNDDPVESGTKVVLHGRKPNAMDRLFKK